MKIKRSAAVAAGVLLVAVQLQTPAHAATTVAKLACTKAGVIASAAAVMGANTQTHALASDYTWSASDVQNITLKSTITITKAGTYRLKGTMTNGQVIVNVIGNGVVRLILAGANITSTKGAAILVKAAPKVVIVAQAGTKNSLADAKTRLKGDTASAAALYSKASLTLAGTGALTVNGRFADGIAGTDGVVITGGVITVNAKDDGIRGKDYVYISGGTISITATGDGIRSAGTKASTVGYVYVGGGTIDITSKSDGIQGMSDAVIADGTLKITAGDDAITSSCVTYVEKATLSISAVDDAVHSDGETVVRSGEINVSKSYEGIEGAYVAISGGTINIVSSDDGINAAGGVDSSGFSGPGQQQTTAKTEVYSNTLSNHFQLSGGTIWVNALGDGMDINGSAEITGGKLIVSGPTANDNAALDVDTTFNITGGIVMGVGSSGMVIAPTATSTQSNIVGNFASTQAANSIIHVVDADGNVVASFKSPKTFQSIVFSSADIVKGKSYKIYVGGTVSGTAIGGYYSSGSISGATLYGSVVAGSYVSSGGPGGPGGPGGTRPTR